MSLSTAPTTVTEADRDAFAKAWQVTGNGAGFEAGAQVIRDHVDAEVAKTVLGRDRRERELAQYRRVFTTLLDHGFADSEEASVEQWADELVARIERWTMEEINRERDGVARPQERAALRRDNATLRAALEHISATAHCIAKAGPLNTPTLADAWLQFMRLDAMASAALAAAGRVEP